MKLTKREKTLLQVLCGMIILFVYFYLLILPQWNRLKELKATEETYNWSIEAVEASLASKGQTEKEIEDVLREIGHLKDNYFVSIDQGSIILLLDKWIETSGLHVPAMTFSEYRKELLGDQELETITLTVPFEGDYEALMSLLKEVRNHEKRVLISQLNIQNDFEGNIKGNILMDFYKIDGINAGSRSPFISEETSKPSKFNPFSPFLGYIRSLYDFEENLQKIDDYLSNPSGGIDYNNDSTNEEEQPLPKETVISLNDFETVSTFFVGEPREIVGQLFLDTNHQSGQNSLRLDYDFFRPRQKAVANVVFEEGTILLQDQPEKIQLSVYTYSENGHSIGLVLRDSMGKEHYISLAQQMNWRGWRQLGARLPQGISYPAILQRVVIEAKDFDPTTVVTLLMDQLNIVYPAGYVPMKARQEQEPPTTGQNKVYQVQKGDTLFSIAMKFYQDATAISRIMETNNITDATEIFVGQNLIIPQFEKETIASPQTIEYVVQKGDTLFSISRKFYNDPTKRHLIMEYNGISNENHVEVGQTLLIPKL